MTCYDCTDPAQRLAGLADAATAVRTGQLVVLPTDTVYGVAAHPADPAAVAALLAAKGRGSQMPPPVLLSRIEELDWIAVRLPAAAAALIGQFWPGGLTVIVNRRPDLGWELGDRHGTVALRIPDDDLALDLLTATGPLAVSSANLTGQPAAHTAVQAATQLGRSIAVYLDGGARTGGQPSSIVDCTAAVPRLVRAGAISLDRLRIALPELVTQ